MRICPCGGILSQHEVKAGTVWHCGACGRREVMVGYAGQAWPQDNETHSVSTSLGEIPDSNVLRPSGESETQWVFFFPGTVRQLTKQRPEPRVLTRVGARCGKTTRSVQALVKRPEQAWLNKVTSRCSHTDELTRPAHLVDVWQMNSINGEGPKVTRRSHALGEMQC